MSEEAITLGEHIGEALDEIKKDKVQLDALSADITTRLQKFEEFLEGCRDLYDPKIEPELFKHHKTIRDALGFTLYLVIELEKKQNHVEVEEQKQPYQTQIVVNAANHKEEEEQQPQTKPSLIQNLTSIFRRRPAETVTEVIKGDEKLEIVEIGKKLLPVFNRILEWREGNIHRFHLLPNSPEGRWFATIRESYAYRRLINSLKTYFQAAIQYINQDINSDMVSIARAQAQALQMIQATQLTGFSEEGFEAGPQGFTRRGRQRR
ncbi:MAG: hypothetical protein QXE57_05075 [Nitrososphaerales archaeon]